MEKFAVVLLGIIFVTLISNSVQSAAADHLEQSTGIYKDRDSVNFMKTTDSNSKYKIHVHAVVRDVGGQLISVAESDAGNYIPHEISDHVFEKKLGDIEIITIDNIKYEKVQYVNTADLSTLSSPEELNYMAKWSIQLCGEFGGHEHNCIPVFQCYSAAVFVTEIDVATIHWTILKEIK